MELDRSQYSKYQQHLKGLTLRIRPFFYIRPNARMIETLSLLEIRPHLTDCILRPSVKFCEPNPTKLVNFEFAYSKGSQEFNELQQETIVSCINLLRTPTERMLLIQGTE